MSKLPKGINYQCDACGICTDELRFAEEHIKLTNHTHYTKRFVVDIAENIRRTLSTMPKVTRDT